MHHDNGFNHINAFFPLQNTSIYLLYIHLHFLYSLLEFFRTYLFQPFQIITTTHHTTPPLSLSSSPKRSRQTIHNEGFDDNLSMISDNCNDRRDDNSESDCESYRQPSGQAMGKQPL